MSEPMTDELRPPLAAVLWLSIRPKTLTAGLAPILVGTGLAHQHGGIAVGPAIAALLGAIAIQIGTNLFNDVEDFQRGADNAARLGPARATQRGWLSPREVLGLAIGAFALATLIGLYLVAVAGWPVVAIGLLSLVSGFLYTGGPAPLAYVGLGDVFVFVFFGLVAVMGTCFVQEGSWPWQGLAAGAAVGGIATAILVVNNLRDRATDAAAGKRTLVVRYGPAAARQQYLGLVGLSYAVPALVAVTTGAWFWLLPLLSLPLARSEWVGVRDQDGTSLNARLAGTARLGLVHGLLLAVGVAL